MLINAMNAAHERAILDYFNDDLSRACYLGQADIVELLLSSGTSVTYNSITAACDNGQTAIAKMLLQKDSTIPNSHIYTLLTAARFGYIDLLNFVLPKCGQWMINNAFDYAVEYGQYNSVKFLLDNGYANSFDYALIVACKYGYYDIVALLLLKDVYIQRVNFEDVLDKKYYDIADLLLYHGFKIRGPISQHDAVILLNRGHALIGHNADLDNIVRNLNVSRND